MFVSRFPNLIGESLGGQRRSRLMGVTEIESHVLHEVEFFCDPPK